MMGAEIKATDKRLEALRKELQEKDEQAQRMAKQLEVQEKELESLRQQMLRLQADFDNAKKRWLKEQAEFQETANGELLRELIEIHDDFERALAAPESAQEKAFREGIQMIARRLEEFLRSYGVAPMETVGKPFDPEMHEAVAHEPTDAAPESTVLQELRRGYWMNGKVLRHAVVKVAVKGGA